MTHVYILTKRGPPHECEPEIVAVFATQALAEAARAAYVANGESGDFAITVAAVNE